MQQVDIYSRAKTFEVVIGEQGSSRTDGSLVILFVKEKFDIKQNCFMGTDFHVSMGNNHWTFLDLMIFNVLPGDTTPFYSDVPKAYVSKGRSYIGTGRVASFLVESITFDHYRKGRVKLTEFHDLKSKLDWDSHPIS